MHPGYGWSEPNPRLCTSYTMATELHTLLVNDNVQDPYVLVGHSLGSLLMRVYTHNYPDEVVGMVLVDSAHEEQFFRYPESVLKASQDLAGQFRMFALLNSTGVLALAPQNIPNRVLPDDVLAQYRAILVTTRYFETHLAELNALEGSYAEVLALHMTSLENSPLIVLRRGYWDATPLLSDADNQQLWEIWQVVQSELAALSSEAKQIIAEKSNHHVHLDQPDLVVDAIRENVDANNK